MLKPANKAEVATVGVLIGRFQVPKLHEIHKELIQTVAQTHPKTIVFLGLAPIPSTRNNPLDFESRKQMLLAEFPDITVLYIKDCKSDEIWSKHVDKQISDIIGPNDTVLLYGGRDSFIKHYVGKFATTELESDRILSGSEIRKEISKKTKASAEFREGVIWGAHNRFPVSYACVDVAILNEDETKVLMARKPEEKEYRFVGGFADPSSPSYEADARREVVEEASIEITDPVYLGSILVDDWRYRNEIDKIKTSLFVCKYMFGKPEAHDDICEIRWILVEDLQKEAYIERNLVPEHRRLTRMLFEKHFKKPMVKEEKGN